MKKLFKGALLATALFGMVACGPQAPAQPEPEEKCTEHEDGYNGWFVTGPDVLAVDGVKAANNKGKSWGFGGDSFELKEITLAQAKEIDAEVGAALEAKGTTVKKIRSIAKVSVGLESAGYTKKFKAADGKLMIADGSYTLKVINATYGAEDDVWSVGQWTPNPHDAHVENLKNYFIPTWQEAADEDGFSWADDSVVTAGAGIYTIIFAEYTTPAAETSCNYGIALVKTEAKEGVAYEEVPTETVLSLIGEAVGGWGDNDVDLTKNENVYTVTYEFPANKQWKVRANHAWADSWGFGALDVANSTAKVAEGTEGDGTKNGNLVFTEAGTYTVKVTLDGANASIVITEAK